jgi:hypothetical protein
VRQSTVIFGSLVFAFIVYITLRGQLPDYLALFSSKPSSSAPASNADKTSGSNSVFGDFSKYLPENLSNAMNDALSTMGL